MKLEQQTGRYRCWDRQTEIEERVQNRPMCIQSFDTGHRRHSRSVGKARTGPKIGWHRDTKAWPTCFNQASVKEPAQVHSVLWDQLNSLCHIVTVYLLVYPGLRSLFFTGSSLRPLPDKPSACKSQSLRFCFPQTLAHSEGCWANTSHWTLNIT